jgi:hypothetical protein
MIEASVSKAEPPKRNRRWFQFSLRTLLLLITLAAIWCGWQAHLVSERKATSGTLREKGATFITPDTKRDASLGVSLWLRVHFIGDSPIDAIWLPRARFSEKDAANVRAIFPEAKVERIYGEWRP